MILDPGVIESLLCRVSRRDVFLDEALKELFGLRRMSWERLMIEMEVTFDNIANDFELRVSWERYFARKHNV